VPSSTATQDNHFRYRRGADAQRLPDGGRGQQAGDDVVLYSPISSSDQLHQPALSNTLGEDGSTRGGASPPRRRCKPKPALPPVYPHMVEDDEMADGAGSALWSTSVGTPSRRPRGPWAVSETHAAEEDAHPYDASTTPRVKQVALRAMHKSNIVFSPQTDFAAVGMELGDDLSWSAADMQFFSLGKESKEQQGLQAHVQLPGADTGVAEEGTHAGADDSGDDSDAAAKPPTPPPPVSRDMATFRIS